MNIRDEDKWPDATIPTKEELAVGEMIVVPLTIAASVYGYLTASFIDNVILSLPWRLAVGLLYGSGTLLSLVLLLFAAINFWRVIIRPPFVAWHGSAVRRWGSLLDAAKQKAAQKEND